MKDIHNIEIEVGDTVLCSGGNYKQLLERVVIRVTPKTCLVCKKEELWTSSYEELSKDWMKREKKVQGQVYILAKKI